MIDTPIHHRGGPLFFVLSLFPFFLFLLWLRRGEARTRPSGRLAVADLLRPQAQSTDPGVGDA